MQGILSTFLEEDSLLAICKEIVKRWSEMQNVTTKVKKKKEGEVQAIATLIEKQAQIMVKPRMVSEEEGQRLAALLAQYADVTDEVNEKDDLVLRQQTPVLTNLCSEAPMWKTFPVLGNWSETRFSCRGRTNYRAGAQGDRKEKDKERGTQAVTSAHALPSTCEVTVNLFI
ncbi:hypothetical protein U0070_024042 [Myodes glareolus]|uniref:Uncharacterized protein n=1 Tax=Myodes glareolus TaxID=447135 RepID=A0AAW0I0N8_MYOGA